MCRQLFEENASYFWRMGNYTNVCESESESNVTD